VLKQFPGEIIRCPRCGRTDVRRSLPRGPIDHIFMKLGKVPLRCRGCEHRFFRAVITESAAGAGGGPPEDSAS